MMLMLFPLFCMCDDYEGNNCRNQNSDGKASLGHNIYEDPKSRERLFMFIFHQKTELARRRELGGPQGAHTCPGAPEPLAATGGGVATLAHSRGCPSAYFIPPMEKP